MKTLYLPFQYGRTDKPSKLLLPPFVSLFFHKGSKVEYNVISESTCSKGKLFFNKIYFF